MEAPEQLDEEGTPLTKVLVELRQEVGTTGERLWARQVADDLFEIRNVPWYAHKLNWGDIVRCAGLSPADLPIVREVVERSGHRTVRVFFNEKGVSKDEQETILGSLAELQAFHERHGANFLALDVEPQADYEAVLAVLVEQSESQRLVFEEAWRWGADTGFGPSDDPPQETPTWLGAETSR